MSDEAFIALGSNLGDRHGALVLARRELERLGRLTRSSRIYRTAPHGVADLQPDYLNAVVALVPHAAWSDPSALLAELLAIEGRHGRRRRTRWAARTLDLDLLSYGRQLRSSADLELPHPRMMERAFVLAPLCEMAPEWRHPLIGRTACECLDSLPTGEVERTELSWFPR